MTTSQDGLSNGILNTSPEVDEALARLHRIMGQLKAIEKMLSAEASGKTAEGDRFKMIVHQLQAVISALGGLKVEIIQQRLRKKLLKELDEAVKSLR